MARPIALRQLLAVLVLPGTVTIVGPVVLHAGGTAQRLPIPPAARVALFVAGAVLVLAGVALAATSIGLFSRSGEGTLAPWDPTQRLVVRGPYRHVRNPMISGVMAVLLGEAAVLGTVQALGWFLGFVLANVLYMPLVEEPGLERRFGD